MRKTLGNLKRGLTGLIQDKIIKEPKLNKNLKSITIGSSVNNKDILCYKIGNGTKKIMYLSAIHGNEVGTIKLAKHIANWALKSQSSLKDYTIYVIPCLNPDGYKIAMESPGYFSGGRSGRFNSNNVDLNRNFNTPSFQQNSYWKHGQNYSNKTTVYCGETPESEPEIRHFTKFIKDQKISTIFSFHNAGRDVLGGATRKSQELASNFAKHSGFKLLQKGYWQQLDQTGTLAEWCDIHEINYIEIEGSTRWGSDWARQKEAIISTLYLI